MRDFIEEDPPWRGNLNWADLAALCTDLAVTKADPDHVRDVATKFFEGHITRPQTAQQKVAFAQQRKSISAQIARKSREHRGMDDVVIVEAAERVACPHGIKKFLGVLLTGVSVLLLAPIPFVASAGIYESEAIELVYEYPWYGLLYGVAPIGGALSVHHLKDSFRTDAAKLWFDRAIYSGTLGAAIAWAALFGPTFLADSAGGFGAAASSAVSLSSWYFSHLMLEFCAGAASLNAAISLMTSGMKAAAFPNEAKSALGDVIKVDEARDLSLAEQEDQLTQIDRQFEAALVDFQERCLLHVAVARSLLDAHSASDAPSARAAACDALTDTFKNGETNA